MAHLSSDNVPCHVGCLQPDDGMIRCDLCRSWFHKSCAGDKDPELKEILIKPKKSNIPFWQCWKCAMAWSLMIEGDVSNILTNMDSKIEQLNQKFECEKDALMTIIREKEKEIVALTDLLLQFRMFTQFKYGDLTSLESGVGNVPAPPLTEALLPSRLDLAGNDSIVTSESIIDTIVPVPICKKSSVNVNISQKNVPNVKPRDYIRVPNNKDILILGSSLLKGTQKFIKENNVHVAMRSGATLLSIRNELEKAAVNDKLKTAILHIGGNDIKGASEPDYIIGDMWTLVELMKVKFPCASIVVNGIVQRSGISFKLIKEINGGLKWLSDVLKVSYADPNMFIKSFHLARDGVHLNDSGVRIFSDFLKNSLNLVRCIKNT